MSECRSVSRFVVCGFFALRAVQLDAEFEVLGNEILAESGEWAGTCFGFSADRSSDHGNPQFGPTRRFIAFVYVPGGAGRTRIAITRAEYWDV